MDQPHCITLPRVKGKSGFLSYMDQDGDLPIVVKHFYWVYDVSEDAQRGDHAHLNSDRVLICVSGKLKVMIEGVGGEKFEFELDDPSKVLFFLRWYWIQLTFSKNSILFVASSCTFKEDVIITDYQEFKKLSLKSPFRGLNM